MVDQYQQIPGTEIPVINQSGSTPSLSDTPTPKGLEEWRALAQSNFEASQDYYEQSLQRNWETAARHWNNEHESGSKFYSDAYRFRSRIFRPLTRTTERNSSAATAAALFSNMDVLNVTPLNPTLPNGPQASAIVKALLQYRLENDVQWYLTAMGAWQDAFNYGPCVSYVYWDYMERDIEPEPAEFVDDGEEILDLTGVDVDPESFSDATIEFVGDDINAEELPEVESNLPEYDEGDEVIETFGSMRDAAAQSFTGTTYQQEPEREIVRDNLCIDLIPPENFRADPACDWRDPVNSSPYNIRIVAMYVNEVEERMDSGEWMKLERAEILSAGDKELEYDSVRRAREGEDRADSIDDTTHTKNTEFEVVFCHENFVRLEGREWVYWTLGTMAMLTEPKPLEEVYFHGKRPMVFGYSVIEAHKYSPNGQNDLIKPLQESVNDITNQRIDNIKLAMNKRYVVRRGASVDLQALARNVPGGSVTADNPEQDVSVINTPDVTASSYEEVNRLTVEANEIAGSFSGSSVQSNRALNETVGGMQLLNEGANQLQEFDIRTWVESWVKPTLKLAMLCVQTYENDETIIAIAGQKGLEKWPELTIDQVFPNRNDIWNMPLSMQVNVGLGATAPFQRIQNLTTALQAAGPFVDPARLNNDEIFSEIMAAAGYQDGSRFYMSKQEVSEQQQQNPSPPPPEVQAEMARQQFEMEKLKIQSQTELQKEQMKLQQEAETQQMKLQQETQLTMLQIAAENDMTMKQLQAQMAEAVMNNKTTRDTVAIQEGNKANELRYKERTGNPGI